MLVHSHMAMYIYMLIYYITKLAYVETVFLSRDLN